MAGSHLSSRLQTFTIGSPSIRPPRPPARRHSNGPRRQTVVCGAPSRYASSRFLSHFETLCYSSYASDTAIMDHAFHLPEEGRFSKYSRASLNYTNTSLCVALRLGAKPVRSERSILCIDPLFTTNECGNLNSSSAEDNEKPE